MNPGAVIPGIHPDTCDDPKPKLIDNEEVCWIDWLGG